MESYFFSFYIPFNLQPENSCDQGGQMSHLTHALLNSAGSGSQCYQRNKEEGPLLFFISKFRVHINQSHKY